ncbi:MAG TPA: iron uptake transporter permease EfeU [Mycobacteriales bacterium]|nr:iron uptake transporter permease EfeU [Mycobacteriales bacterium]
MLPTFVIGLREGLEAALIVGIIAAFLRKQERGDLLRWVYAGVGTAILLCVAVGVGLELASRDLPQSQQEGLETVVGVLAVGMVTYMVVWMRRHSRELKGTLEGAAANALATGSTRAGRAMVAMAFLAVLREGFETVVFLLAAFNETGNGAGPIAGAVLGIAVAVVLGWGIYRGGVRINLSKFFRATGLVLVLVAAGLVVTALHTAHEAGWLDAGQGQTVDLTWLVRPGSVQASLLTGMLGVQQHPVVIEVIGWLVYLVPIGIYVAWPPGRSVPVRGIVRGSLAAGAAAAVAAGVVAIAAPAGPAARPTTSAAGGSARVVSSDAAQARVRLDGVGGFDGVVVLKRVALVNVNGLKADRYASTTTAADPSQPTRRLSGAAIARLNGGRLPIGVMLTHGTAAVSYSTTTHVVADLEPHADRIVGLRWSRQAGATVEAAVGPVPLGRPKGAVSGALPASVVAAAVAAGRHDVAAAHRRDDFQGAAWTLGVAAIGLLVAAATCLIATRRTARRRTSLDHPAPEMVGTKVRLT